jgi:diguanylate cyclase
MRTDPNPEPTDESSASSQILAENQQFKLKMAKCQDELRNVEGTLADVKAALRDAEEEAKLARSLALHDRLTKLATRELFDEELANAIAIAGRRSWSLAVMFLDIDCFKVVNDFHGHAVGDAVIQETANRLMQCSRDEDTICRNGGDEFLYLILDPKSRKDIETILSRATEAVSNPLKVDGQALSISISVGVAVYPQDGVYAEQLIGNADSAMYQAKARKSAWHFFGE